MSTTPITVRSAVAWAVVEDAWRTGSEHCQDCDHHRFEIDPVPYQEGTAALSTDSCGLLEDGTGTDYLRCPALLATHAERAQALRQRSLDVTVPAALGSSFAVRLQANLLAHRRPRSLRAKLSALLLTRRRPT